MNTSNITRRHFFQDCGIGTGKIALSEDQIQPEATRHT
jgi:hypothetical protein